MRVAAVLVSVAVLGGVAACGSSSKGGGAAAGGAATAAAKGGVGSTSAAAGAFDPCKVLTAAQVMSALGGTVAAGAPSTDDTLQGPACDYAVTGASLIGAGTFEVRDDKMNASQFGLAKDGLVSGGAYAAVTGVGTDAFYSKNTDSLTILTGGTTFSLQGTGDNRSQDPAKVMSALVNLGKLAAK